MNVGDAHQNAREKFEEFCKSRDLKDFSSIIQVMHQDGSVFVLHHAAIWYSEEYENVGHLSSGVLVPRWIGVSTEHNGDHLFFASDLIDWWVK